MASTQTTYLPCATAPVSPPVAAYQIAARVAPPPRVVNTRDGVVVTHLPRKEPQR